MRAKKQPPAPEPRVLQFIREHQLISGQRDLLVAVSGGPDSVCMLHILTRLQEQLGVRLHIAHLNHQLRGEESEADAQYIAELASRLGIPVTIARRDVKAYHTGQHVSLEEAAREVRYNFLAEVAKSIAASVAAVGHTTDDHIETILLHLVRGTGTRGLRGLQPNSHWQSSRHSLNIIRPLLTISREETAEYCRQHQLMPRIDASNLSLSPLRNRIRYQLLPQLKRYNPRMAEALLRTARIAGDDLAFLDETGAKLWDEIAQRQGNTIILEKKKFLELPAALKRHLLRMSIEKLIGNLVDIEARHIEEIIDVLTKPAGRRIDLPRGLNFSVEYGRYLLSPDQATLSPFPVLEAQYSLQIPGETRIPGWCIEATVTDREQTKETDNFTACFDLDKTGDKLVIRPRQPGDRFQPLGMSQPKKLGVFMIDSKIPQTWRQRIPIVCSPRQILWAVGWRIDERAKVTESTRRFLRLRFEREY